MRKTYFIIRDEASFGDVATVWNFHADTFAWDMDAYYTAADGFEYADKRTATMRAEAIRKTNRFQNVRVVTREELFDLRGIEDHAGPSYR